MEHKEISDIAAQLRNPKDLLLVIQKFLNTGGDTSMRLYLEKEEDLEDWHPTLQQCLMRGFIVPAIKALASDPSPDLRNQGTVRMCKEMLPILEKHGLPFV
jgi:hypothetical protein